MQAAELVCAVDPENLPGSQLVQTVGPLFPCFVEYVPAMQLLQAEAPVEEYVPASQLVH